MMEPGVYDEFLTVASNNRSYSPSLENLYSNKPVLERRLKYRLDREDLVVRGIMPPQSTATIATQVAHLERAKTGDFLQRKIRVRPNRQQLVQRHILADSHADASIQATQTTLERRRIADQLNEQLFNRPGPLELIRENILNPEDPVSEKIKQGDVPFDPICDGLNVTGLFLPDSPGSELDSSPIQLNDHVDVFAEAFSQHVKVEPATQSGQTSPLGSADANMFAISKSSMEADSKALANGIQALNKELQVHRTLTSKVMKKKQVNKVKVKKYKYHEYRPTAMGAKEVDDTPADEHYKKLLEQQTLYLQLQVMQQNALMAALQGNEEKDSCNDVNQEAFRERTSSSVSISSQSFSPLSPSVLEDMKVTELRAELKLRGLPVSGQKAKLIERLRSFDDKNSSCSGGSISPSHSMMHYDTMSSIPSSPDTMPTSMLQTTSQSSVASTTVNSTPNLVCVAPANNLSYQVIQSVPQTQHQPSTVHNFAASNQSVQLQHTEYGQTGLTMTTGNMPRTSAPHVVSQLQYVTSPAPVQCIPNGRAAPFPQQQPASPGSIQVSNTNFPLQIINNSNQLVANSTIPCSVQSGQTVPLSPLYSSFLGTIDGQQVIIHSLNPQQQQQLQQQQLQQQQQQQQIQQQQIQQQQMQQKHAQQQTMRPSGSLPDLQQLKGNQQQLPFEQIQRQQKPQPLMKLENQQWIKQPGIPVSDDNAFMMFKLKPESKGRVPCNRQNSRFSNSNGCNNANGKGPVMSTQNGNVNQCGGSVATSAAPSSSGFNGSMVYQETRMSPLARNNGSNEDLLDILGELSPPIDGGTSQGIRGHGIASPRGSPYSQALRVPKAEPPSYVAACASLSKGNDPVLTNPQLNAGSVPNSLNLFGMETRNSPISEFVDDPFRQRSESTPCKPVSRRANIQTPSPMHIDEDATRMDVDDFVSNCNADLSWLDLSSFSPGTSPQTQLKQAPRSHVSMKDQLFHVSMGASELTNHNTFNYGSPKVTADQPVSIFDLDTSCGLLSDNCDMERWDIY